jgi:serine/threonine-protein kinase
MPGISGKYRLDARLGGGGMAEVFAGSTVGVEGFSRKVAIKRVLPGFSDNPSFAQMFVAEAQISSRLVHPNIVSVVDFDRDPDGRLFLVMELVEGRDLDSLNATGLLPFPVVIFVISELLRGLGYAHDLPVGNDVRGVVHRDVSPQNVLLSWEGAVKISDFGIAKARAASAATASVFIKGKPAYMSPEQANGERLDGRSDLFAVGVILWEMLTGRRLFVGDDTRATLAAVLFAQIPRPRALRGDVPRDLERVVMRLLERDLPVRYAVAEDAIGDLLECEDAPKAGRELLVKTLAERFPHDAPVRHGALRARSGAPVMSHVPDRSLGGARAAPTVAASAKAMRRRRGLVILAGIAAAVAAAAITFTAVRAFMGGGDGALEPGTGSGSNVSARTTIDAAVANSSPVDAGVQDAVVVPATRDPPPPASAHPTAGRGHLTVVAFPVLTVFVDKKNVGDTPKTIQLAAGRHIVRLSNPETGHDETLTVTITENQTLTIDRRK